MNSVERARELNAKPLSDCLDRTQIGPLLAERELIFSDTRIFVAQEHLERMAAFCAAMEDIAVLPGWQDKVFAEVGETARHGTRTHGVFFGYDFHIDGAGPKLIEINTNAGGGPLNAQLLKAQRGERAGLPDADEVERRIVAMFIAEWHAGGHNDLPGLIAIVDDAPCEQYLNPDFEICRSLLEQNGMHAVICDARELRMENDDLYCNRRRVDLVYNRLTDFFLTAPDYATEHAAMRQAWLSDAALITPNPRNYALYADKRHLTLLCDDLWLASIGVSEPVRALVRAVVPRTERVSSANAEDIHARRKQLFFKPATGFGSKATYRGQNVTTRVFGEIVADGNYVAQALVPPAMRMVEVNGVAAELKFDLRCYAYRGEVLLTAARLWQGQTTNFRTRGGGFTPVVEVT